MRGKLFMSKYGNEHSQCPSRVTLLKRVYKLMCEQYRIYVNVTLKQTCNKPEKERINYLEGQL